MTCAPARTLARAEQSRKKGSVKWFGLVGADKQSAEGSDGSGARLRMTKV